MPKSVQEGFDAFVGRLIPTDAQRANGKAHRASIKGALESKLSVLNFFETGSFSHGTGVRGRSDIDALVSLDNAKPLSTYTALEWVKSTLSSRFPTTEIVIRRPAVVVKFAAGYETWEIIPGFVTGAKSGSQLVYDIPGPSTGSDYIKSSPKAHLGYVNESNNFPVNGKAKRLARLIKAWKYYNNVPISSFYLEMRCARYVRGLETYVDVYDVCLLLESLNSHGLTSMNDPAGAVGRIQPCSSDTRLLDAKSKLSTGATRSRKALDAYTAGNHDVAFSHLGLLFGGNFPAR